jgi:hypothetical protein
MGQVKKVGGRDLVVWLEDQTGNGVVAGFTIGRCSAYMAELWGAFVGLKLTYSKGYKIELLLDAKVVAENILDPNTVSTDCRRLMQHIRRILQMDYEVRVYHVYRRVYHVYREANGCADALTNMGCDHDPYKVFYEQQHPLLI